MDFMEQCQRRDIPNMKLNSSWQFEWSFIVMTGAFVHQLRWKCSSEAYAEADEKSWVMSLIAVWV